MATRRPAKPKVRSTSPATTRGKPELVVMMRPQAALRASAGRFESAAGANVKDLGRILAKHGARMAPLFGATEERVMARAGAGRSAPRAPAPELAAFYRIAVPARSMAALRAQLERADLVQAAYIKPAVELPVVNAMVAAPEEPPPTTPDWSARQRYLDAPPDGIDARWAWTQVGGRGRDVRIIDVEGDWRFTHEDLTTNQGGVLGGNTALYGADVNWRNHGTAVLGEYSGDGAVGVIGIASDAIASAVSHGDIGSAAAIALAASRLSAGDVLLLEMHRPGPRFGFASRNDQRGYIAVEWWPDDFAAIADATSRGIVVVEAAGNGAEDLDDALYDAPAAGFPTDWTNPFRRANRDSGAIVVGAGAPPPGTHDRDHGPDRSRLDFSNYGALVDAQAWGREVTTAGYGDLQGGSDEDLWYTDTFGGTSSASPIVTGAIACVQGMIRARGRPLLTAAQFRACLRATGSPQQDAPGRPATQRIGNRPDIRALAACAFGKSKEVGKETGKEGGKESKEAKETKEKENAKDAKELKEGKEVKEAKELHEKHLGEANPFLGTVPGADPRADAGTEQRLAALENAVQQLVHFIGADLRPDLTRSALQEGSDAAKREKDMKDTER